MAGETTITVVGNLTADPELRFTQGGAAVVSFTVASTPRKFDKASGEWKDGEALFMRCSAWRQMAENVAETLKRGSRVIAQGSLKQRTFDTKDGERRTVIELEVDEVGPSLRYATAKVNRPDREGAGASQGQYARPSAAKAADDDLWNTAPAPAPVGPNGYNGEPPF
ncbi:MAG TPA: single-stranded DNA-binding protein [Pseudonocardia sp.]|jgi:single-strand DNA-binding protein